VETTLSECEPECALAVSIAAEPPLCAVWMTPQMLLSGVDSKLTLMVPVAVDVELELVLVVVLVEVEDVVVVEEDDDDDEEEEEEPGRHWEYQGFEYVQV
jgi:hypothetical protein